MKPVIIERLKRSTAMLLLALTVGCSSQQPLSNYARTGDTVAVALGGTEQSNALVEILKKEDIDVRLTDSAGAVHSVKLRNLFRTYGDYTSGYIHRSNRAQGQGPSDVYVPPYMGQWIAVVDLIDPASGSAPALAVGAATLEFSAPTQLNSVHYYYGGEWNWTWTNGNLSSIPMEILPGTGSPNPLNNLQQVSYSPIAALEPLTQILVSPAGTPETLLGGGTFTFVYDPAEFGAPLKAVPSGHDPYVQISSSVTNLEDGNRLLKVIIMNPKGFLPDNELRGNAGPGSHRSPYKSLRFSLVWDSVTQATNVTDANWQNAIQLVADQSGYIDLDGNAVSSISPFLAKVH